MEWKSERFELMSPDEMRSRLKWLHFPIMQPNYLPTFEQLTSQNFDFFQTTIGSAQVNDSEFESFLETHPDECDKVFEEFQNFSVTKLRDQLTVTVLDSLPFPYQTMFATARKKELINWLNRHRSMKTNNIDLLRQRLTNYFKMKIHQRSFIHQERARSIIGRHLSAAKASLANTMDVKKLRSEKFSQKVANIIHQIGEPEQSSRSVGPIVYRKQREPVPFRSEQELRLDKVVWPIVNRNMWSQSKVRTVPSQDHVPQHVVSESEDDTNLVNIPIIWHQR